MLVQAIRGIDAGDPKGPWPCTCTLDGLLAEAVIHFRRASPFPRSKRSVFLAELPSKPTQSASVASSP